MSRAGSKKRNEAGLRAVSPETSATAAEEPEQSAQSEQEVAGEQGAPAGGRASRGLPPDRLKAALESLVFVSDKPVAPAQLAKVVRTPAAVVRSALEELVSDYRERGIELAQVGGGYLFRSASESAPYVKEFLAQRPVRLTRAQLETLAIVSYRQPATRPEIEEIRGVDTGSALHVLLERGLLKILGRKDEPGRPLLYGTTPYFLEFFGLRSLKDLPTLREFSELSEESRDLYARKMGNSPEQEGVGEAQMEGAVSAGDRPEAEAEAAEPDAPDGDGADPDDAGGRDPELSRGDREVSEGDGSEGAGGEKTDDAGP